jgi:Xaa-Pro aminopeptidase
LAKITLSQTEYENRIRKIREELSKRQLDALYLTSDTSVIYTTGFSHISTERPAALIIPLDGEIAFMGPVIERDHIKATTPVIKRIYSYLDYPGKTHPMDLFAGWLREIGLGDKSIGIDNPAGASGRWGYTGPPISEKLPTARFVNAKDVVQTMRLIKSDEEVALLRESSKWATVAHRYLQKLTKPGLWDVEVALKASLEASKEMKKKLGLQYEQTRWGLACADANFRGQVGEGSAIPHAISTKRKMRKGDVLVTGAGADVGGYSAELERTMVLGKPTEKQRKYFEIMVKMQDAALNTFGPDVKCSDADKATIKIVREHGAADYLLHHTGHGIGLEGHEPPWIDQGNSELLKPGMIVSCEPGIYIPGLGGFRHSDTVLITKRGSELITSYPRDIKSLSISAR